MAEADLTKTSFKELILERIKKMMLDMTSIKFQSLLFVAWGMSTGKIEELYGLGYMAAVLGIKEFGDIKAKVIDITQKVTPYFPSRGKGTNEPENPGA